MTAQREQWYLDRLRTELVRAAAIEDRRERRRGLGRLRLRWRPAAAVALAIAVVALVVVAGGMLSRPDDEQPATPRPTATATATAGEAILRRLDGVYVAEVTPAMLRGTRVVPPPPTGWWRITIHSADRKFILSAPEGPDSGDLTLDITRVERGRLTLGPDTGCEKPQQRSSPATVEFSVVNGMLTLRNARGGCSSMWTLVSSTPWGKA